MASCLLHVLVLFLALHLRFQPDMEQPFRAIEVALISLPSTEPSPSPQPTPKAKTPAVANPTPPVPQPQPKTEEDPLPPLATTKASERLSDSLGGAVGSIKVPSKLETVSPPATPSSIEQPSASSIDRAPLIDKIQLPAAPPEISRPDRLTPSQPVRVPRVNRSPEPETGIAAPVTPKPIETQPQKVEQPSQKSSPMSVPEPPTLDSSTPFPRTLHKEPTSTPTPKKSLASALKESLPSIPSSMSPKRPITKSSPHPSEPPRATALPKMTQPQLAQIPTTPTQDPPVPQESSKTSDFIKQLMAGVKAPSIQPAPVPQAPSSGVSPAPTPTPSPPLKSELDQQLAKLNIPTVAPVESIKKRLQLVQTPSSSGSSSSKPSQGENRYLAMVEDAIDQRWVAPPLTLNNPVVVIKFRIAKYGEISQAHMEQSSGNDHYDLAALRAVQAVNPLPPFPPDLQKSFIDVSYRFIKQD
ncbi:MAG: TonB family protein [Nitrospirales bacterium]|nr:TonB family protein [Nitrospirales bacterium]